MAEPKNTLSPEEIDRLAKQAGVSHDLISQIDEYGIADIKRSNSTTNKQAALRETENFLGNVRALRNEHSKIFHLLSYGFDITQSIHSRIDFWSSLYLALNAFDNDIDDLQEQVTRLKQEISESQSLSPQQQLEEVCHSDENVISMAKTLLHSALVKPVNFSRLGKVVVLHPETELRKTRPPEGASVSGLVIFELDEAFGSHTAFVEAFSTLFEERWPSLPQTVREEFINHIHKHYPDQTDTSALKLDSDSEKSLEQNEITPTERAESETPMERDKRIYRSSREQLPNPNLEPQASANRTKKQANLRLTPEFLAQVDKAAKAEGLSRTDFITRALEYHLK